jgi:hypothetical protein
MFVLCMSLLLVVLRWLLVTCLKVFLNPVDLRALPLPLLLHGPVQVDVL